MKLRLIEITDFLKFMEWMEHSWLSHIYHVDDSISFEEYVAEKLSISETEAIQKITDFYSLYLK